VQKELRFWLNLPTSQSTQPVEALFSRDFWPSGHSKHVALEVLGAYSPPMHGRQDWRWPVLGLL